jgi:ACS family D-galactonate transporter-like MFS transporter
MGGLGAEKVKSGRNTSHLETRHLVPGTSVVLALLVASVILNYVDRSNLSIAAPMLKDELKISAEQLGWLLSAFFWTYASCQILAGWLVDRLDVKYVFAAGFVLWSAATAVTGLLHGLAALLAIRVLLGIGESVSYPSYSKIVARLFPEQNRGFANSLIASGLSVGPGIGLLFGGVLMSRFGWRPFFIVLGLASFLWLPPWLRWMPRAPDRPLKPEGPGPGYMELLRCRDLWGVSLGLFSNNYFNYFLLTWLPLYLMGERGLTMRQMARVGAAYFFTAAISASICGRLSDYWIVRGGTPTRVRKGFMITGCMSGGLLLIAVVQAPRGAYVVLLLMLGVAFGMCSSNVFVITQRLAGQQAVGRWCGIQLFFSNLSGVIAPAVAGFLVQRSGHFTSAFCVVAGVLWAGALVWAFVVGKVEPVRWRGDEQAAA